MKKGILIFVLLIASIAAVSAQGWGGWGRRGGWGWGDNSAPYAQSFSEETVNGTLTIDNGVPTVGEYTLIVPGQMVLQSGDAVEARGLANGSTLLVSWIKINNDEYVMGGRWNSGWNGDNATNGWVGGPGYCWGGGW